MPTPRFGLPFIAQGQAQKEVTHNDALIQLDALVDLFLLDRDLSAPPSSPANGDTYLVAASPTGAWAGQAGKIAYALDGGWRFYGPIKGLVAYVADEQVLLVYTGSLWVDWASLLSLQNLVQVGIRTTADATNRLAVKSNAVLFSHDDVTPGTGDMRVVINKSAAAKDAGFTFQDSFSTRALFGLLGDDNVTLKVSPDGSAFFGALSVDKATGNVGLSGYYADGINELGVKATSILFDRKTAHIRALFNKAAPGDDASFGFETNYSPRALLGLLGDDNFTIKVSPDGSAFTVAISIDKTTGAVTVAALTANGAVALSPANANVVISPTGTGTVTINPAAAGAMNNVNVGATTAGTGRFTTLTATGAVTLSPANANVAISPTGTGSVTISPAGALTINPTAASAINNCSIGATTASTVRGTTINATTAFQQNGTQVVAARRTGWAAATGTATRATFATGSVTLPQLAERLKALIDDLIAHGLIGA